VGALTRKIIVEELTRVEGHGRIEVVIEGDRVKDVKMDVFEGPRFFEALIETVHYDKVPDIMRRICAICTASHSLASIRAIEEAFGVEATPQTQLLRDLLIHGEMVESHALHLFFLALPDYLGYPDAISMAADHPDAVGMALGLKKAGNMVHNVLSGREVHGMNERVGGFSKVPSEEELLRVRAAMEASMKAAEFSVDLLTELDTPAYPNSRNMMMALDPGERFGFLGDHILTSNGERRPVSDYIELTNERTVKHSYAKHSSHGGSPFMVGALPRVLLNGDKLRGRAGELYEEHGSMLDGGNSLWNNLAQALELVHSVERCVEDIDALLSRGVEPKELAEVEVAEGRGVAAVEAPRGVLYHDYSFDDNGRITRANVVTPTAQNLANMEKDYRAAAQRLVGEPDGRIMEALELIARAYDPCISCSVHLVRVKP
jgi:sulfhydrogenase subunit alpha